MKKVVSVELMRSSDKYTIENFIISKELMYKAGEAVFNSYSWNGKIAVFCGGGNNGGDGFVLASLLKKANFDVSIFLVSNKFTEDSRYYFDVCKELKVDIYDYNDSIDINCYDIIVDCILGTGFKGEIREDIKNVILKINNSNSFVISVDINSGLNGDNGFTTTAIKSNLTISIGYLKSGHFLNMAKDYIDKVENCDIGIRLIGNPYYLMEDSDFHNIIKDRKNYSNKGTYGRVAIIGGCLKYSGAIKLSNLSCSVLRAGAGLVSLVIPESIVKVVIPYVLESTVAPISDTDGFMKFDKDKLFDALQKVNSVIIGPGWGNGPDNVKILEYILNNYSFKVVIDADGINTLALMDKEILNRTSCEVVITPHVAEFSRLTGLSVDKIILSPIETAKTFAKKYGVTVLLKGTTTVVTNGDTVYLVSRGCAGMATAGSGDVLSGVIGGINAYSKEDILLNTACGAYVTGIAGELAGKSLNNISMIASDTISKLSEAISSLLSEF